MMHILLHDIRELESFVGELKETDEFDDMDRELLLTRVSGIRHLLEVAAGHANHPAEKMPLSGKPFIEQEPVAEKEPVPVIVAETEMSEEKIPGKTGEEMRMSMPGNTASPVTLRPAETPSAGDEIAIAGELQLEEENVQSQEKQILAEKFTAGKSVNDLLFEKSRSDSRFANRPVINLGNAITTNDKFLFIRELFEGDGDEFSETVRRIDSMTDIHEAAAYLRNHFKWKKNETSLKFIDLVKRRFLS